MEKSEYEMMFKEEKNHWWFIGRRRIILFFIKKIYNSRKNLNILDFGCGTGFNMLFLRNFGKIDGIDISEESLKFCKKRGINIDILDVTKDKIKKYINKYDLITVLDVLEHTEDDELVLKKLYSFLKGNGHIIITVPAFKFLSSNHDIILHHKRRYDKKDLIRKIKTSGLCVEFISYYNCFLLPFAILRKIINPKESSLKITATKHKKIFDLLYNAETFLLSRKLIPVGVSIFCIVKKIG